MVKQAWPPLSLCQMTQVAVRSSLPTLPPVLTTITTLHLGMKRCLLRKKGGMQTALMHLWANEKTEQIAEL